MFDTTKYRKYFMARRMYVSAQNIKARVTETQKENLPSSFYIRWSQIVLYTYERALHLVRKSPKVTYTEITLERI